MLMLRALGEGWRSGGCGEGAVTRAEVLLLCPSRGASSQIPAMSRTLLLLLLLLRGLTSGRPPPAASPRLKLSFRGEQGPRARWGGVGSARGRWCRASITQHHPEGRECHGGQRGGRAAKPRPWHGPSAAAALPAGSQVSVPCSSPGASPSRATCVSLGPHSQPPACAGSGGPVPVCTVVAFPLLSWECRGSRGAGAVSRAAAPRARHGSGGFVQRRGSAGALLAA